MPTLWSRFSSLQYTPFVTSRLYTPSVLICPYVPPIFACTFVRLLVCLLPYLSKYDDKQTATITNLVEQTWLCRCPRPKITKYDRGNEFLGHTFKNDLVENEYGIKAKSATTANPQANSILERIHQAIANIVRTYDFQNNYLEEDDPW